MNEEKHAASSTGARAFQLDELVREHVRDGFSRTGIRSDDALTTINWFEPGYTSVGQHSHPFDQLSYVLTGSMRFFVGDDIIDVVAPAVVHIPGNVPHGAEPLGDEKVLNIDVYAPVREDYLPLCEHQHFGQ